MKCDELEIKYVGYGMGFYPTEDVDEAIAELKEVAKDACLERDDNRKVIDELEAAIEELKVENRRLKRKCRAKAKELDG